MCAGKEKTSIRETRRGEILKEAALSNRESNLHTLHKRDTNRGYGGRGDARRSRVASRRSAGKYCNWLRCSRETRDEF